MTNEVSQSDQLRAARMLIDELQKANWNASGKIAELESKVRKLEFENLDKDIQILELRADNLILELQVPMSKWEAIGYKPKHMKEEK